MTIYDIKRICDERGSHYFSRETLRNFGQRMKDFKVYKLTETTYEVFVPVSQGGKFLYMSRKIFDVESGKFGTELNKAIT